MEAAGDLCPRQDGFRKVRSTIDAIAEIQRDLVRAESHNHFSRQVVLLVTLDIKNVFNLERWVRYNILSDGKAICWMRYEPVTLEHVAACRGLPSF